MVVSVFSSVWCDNNGKRKRKWQFSVTMIDGTYNYLLKRMGQGILQGIQNTLVKNHCEWERDVDCNDNL